MYVFGIRQYGLDFNEGYPGWKRRATHHTAQPESPKPNANCKTSRKSMVMNHGCCWIDRGGYTLYCTTGQFSSRCGRYIIMQEEKHHPELSCKETEFNLICGTFPEIWIDCRLKLSSTN